MMMNGIGTAYDSFDARVDHVYSSNGEEWMYFSEGGNHVVLYYVGDDMRSYFHDKVLRLPKKVLVVAATYPHRSDHDNLLHLSEAQTNDQKSINNFPCSVIKPLIDKQNRYIDNPLLAEAPSGFWFHVYNKILKVKAIPKSRIPEWVVTDSERSQILQSSFKNDKFKALLYTNYTRFPNVFNNEINQTICVEIKPKAGYLATSPLVHHDRRAKFFFSRFELLQQLIADGRIEKGWGTASKQMSRYSPLDFFSGDSSRMDRALRALLDVPQNNLRILSNGNLVWAHNKRPFFENGGNDSFMNALAITCSSKEEVDQKCLEDRLANIIRFILEDESILKDLSQAQKETDFIDADGAIAVYRRLVYLCDSSQDKAERLINFNGFLSENEIRVKHEFSVKELGETYPISRPVCAALDDLMKEVQSFKDYLEETAKNNINSNFLDEAHDRAIRCVQNLSQDACVWVLQMWLISACLNDLSIMITFSLADYKSNQIMSQDSDLCLKTLSADFLKDSRDRQTKIIYRIKVVDVDAKPGRKLRDRDKKEKSLSLSFHKMDSLESGCLSTPTNSFNSS